MRRLTVAPKMLAHAHVDIMRQLEKQLATDAADRRYRHHVAEHPTIWADEPRISAVGDDVDQCGNSDHRTACQIAWNFPAGEGCAALHLLARHDSDTGMDRQRPAKGRFPCSVIDALVTRRDGPGPRLTNRDCPHG